MSLEILTNLQADGRVLHLYLKVGPPTRLESPGPALSLTVPTVPSRGSEDRSDLFSERSGGRAPRHASDIMAEPDYSDGRYGFGGKVGEDTEMEYQAETEDKPRDHRDDRYAHDTRPDQRGYQQDHARTSTSRPERYNPRGNQSRPDRRTYRPDRLYSDGMYNGSRGSGAYRI